jgi:hypothetical protein
LPLFINDLVQYWRINAMGGISALQRWILLLCLENGFLSTQNILDAWREWEPAEWGAKMATVGPSEYNIAHASLSRAISRMWQRGLVIIWKNLTNSATGITLTPDGKVLAQTISEEED